MLIIRCKEGETILVDGDVEVKILSAGPGRIKLGVTAPPEVRVLRKDIEVTRRQNVAAANASTAHFVNTSSKPAVHVFANNLSKVAQISSVATDK